MVKLSTFFNVTCVIFTCKLVVSDVFQLNAERLYDYLISLAITVAIFMIINIKDKHQIGKD